MPASQSNSSTTTTSAAAAERMRKVTRGYAKVPNSFIENQAVLTPSERAFALICFRRGDAIKISDQNWEAWTGLAARQKQYAIAGLKDKGLDVDGQGQDARYTFQFRRWESYVRHSPFRADCKARTLGRSRAVKAAPDMMVHEECRATGCAKLCTSEESKTCQPSPIARTGATSPLVPIPAVVNSGTPASKPVAQPVAQSSGSAMLAMFAQTMAELLSIFPFLGVLFLIRLVAAVRAVVPDVTDSELAEAVRMAWERKRRTQHGEGMFLVTVPEDVLRLRQKQKGGMKSAPPPDPAIAARMAIEHTRKRLSEIGGFESEIDSLGKVLEAFNESRWDDADRLISPLSSEIAAKLSHRLSPDAASAISSAIAQRKLDCEQLLPHKRPDFESAARWLRSRLILDHFEIPNLLEFGC